jgi:putative FmdB family regulatory protein
LIICRGTSAFLEIPDVMLTLPRFLMPTYEYVCAKCHHQFEIVQSISANALTVCPKESCPRKPWGKGKVKRAVSGGAGLIFKGSGFYITDYRSEGYKEAAKKEASASSGSSEGAKKESKPSAEAAKPKAEAAPAKAKPKSD